VRRGFTLLEILLAIGIIALLAAILFPVINGAKVGGQVTAALSNAKQLTEAALLYSVDVDGNSPPSTAYNKKEALRKVWPEILKEYLKSDALLTAPGATPPPSRRYSDRGFLSWGLNADTATNGSGCAGTSPDGVPCEGYRKALSFDSIPSNSALFATTPGGDPEQRYCGHEFEPNNGTRLLEDVAMSPPLVSDKDLVKVLPMLPCTALRPVYARYGSTGQDDGRAVIGLLDGSAKAFTSKQLSSGAAKLVWRLRRVRG